MGLNIKNQRVHDLAREAARITGKSQTSAIEEALERLLRAHEVDPDDSAARLVVDKVGEIATEYLEDPGTAAPAIRRPEGLYDEATGLPQ